MAKPGRHGAQGQTGPPGLRGKRGKRGPARVSGAARKNRTARKPGARGSADPHSGIALLRSVLKTASDDVYRHLDLQMRRIAQMQVQIDQIVAKMDLLTRGIFSVIIRAFSSGSDPTLCTRRRARRGRKDVRGGLPGVAVPTVHSCRTMSTAVPITSAPRSRVTLATLIQTELAAHSGQGDSLRQPFNLARPELINRAEAIAPN